MFLWMICILLALAAPPPPHSAVAGIAAPRLRPPKLADREQRCVDY